jgi:hypothetical protein
MHNLTFEDLAFQDAIYNIPIKTLTKVGWNCEHCVLI